MLSKQEEVKLVDKKNPMDTAVGKPELGRPALSVNQPAKPTPQLAKPTPQLKPTDGEKKDSDGAK